VHRPVLPQLKSGITLMATTYYTKDHEWLTIENDIATLGITNYAQGALGEVVYVEVPDIGTACQNGEPIAVVESVKAASDIYAPLNGEVIEVNTNLEDSPELVNELPESDGWFIKIRLTNPLDTRDYINKEQYLELIQS